MRSYTGLPAADAANAWTSTISVAKLLDIVKDDSTRKNGAAVLYDLVNIYERKIVEAPVTMASQNDPQRRQDASTEDNISQPVAGVNIFAIADGRHPSLQREVKQKEVFYRQLKS